VARAPAAPILALVVVQFSFATLAVVGKDALLLGLPPLALAGLRVFFAGLILTTLAFTRSRDRVAWTDIATLAGLSFLGVAANQLLFIEGLQRTTAINASILIVTIPVFTLLVAVVLGREAFDAKRAIGVGVALVGTLTMLHVERFDLGRDVVVGNLLVVLNCLSYSFYLVLSRPVLQRMPSISVVASTFVLSSPILLPLAVPGTVHAAEAGVFTPRLWADLVWIVLVPSVVAYALNNYALKRLRASSVAGFVFLQPVFGILLALWLLPSETLGARTILAGALILGGVLLLVRAERARPTTP
jgi:drug/metabolite transporter (DMT)-like permease